MKIGSDSRFILEIDSRPFFLGTLLDLWKNLLFPLLDQFRLSLVGTIQRLLATEPKLAQQSSNRGRAKPGAELTFNQVRDHRTGPQCKFKLELPGFFVTNCSIDPFDLGSRKFFRTSATLTGTQTVPSTRTVSGQPVVDTSSRKAQRFNDNFRALSGLYALHRSYAYFFHCLRYNLSSICFSHNGIL